MPGITNLVKASELCTDAAITDVETEAHHQQVNMAKVNQMLGGHSSAVHAVPSLSIRCGAGTLDPERVGVPDDLELTTIKGDTVSSDTILKSNCRPSTGEHLGDVPPLVVGSPAEIASTPFGLVHCGIAKTPG
jgi:hypothetical protein